MFYAREDEMRMLEERYAGRKFECIVLYGRRRVGKTALINAFCKNKRTVFFSAIEGSPQENLKALSDAVYHLQHPDTEEAPVFSGFQQVFREITTLCQKERLVFVIDEFPFLVHAEPSISSRLQHLIDHEWAHLPLFLILCGSSMHFMEHQVLGYESPLYGRRTAQIKLLPMTYLESAQFYPKLSAEQQALLYSISGGIPLYIQKLYQSGSVDHAILENVFERTAYLFEEPENLLKQELREPQTYQAILTAIAEGASKLNEIATAAGIQSGSCAKYISNLIELSIVKKETPFMEKEGKKTLYRISDQFFRFWYRFVRRNISAVSTGRIRQAYDSLIKSYYSDYMGQAFEQMCRDYLLRYDQTLPVTLLDAGRWWGTDKVQKKEVEIDLVASCAEKDTFLFASCKYRNEKTDADEWIRLKQYADVFGKGSNSYYCIFSKSGFTKKLKQEAVERRLKLISLKDMYGLQT